VDLLLSPSFISRLAVAGNMTKAQPFKVVETDSVGDSPSTPAPSNKTTVDLTPVHFSGTFQNPLTWVLIGIGITIGAQCLLAHLKRK